jgi:hypothetical protein
MGSSKRSRTAGPNWVDVLVVDEPEVAYDGIEEVFGPTREGTGEDILLIQLVDVRRAGLATVTAEDPVRFDPASHPIVVTSLNDQILGCIPERYRERLLEYVGTAVIHIKNEEERLCVIRL